jgi:hypothetical protein
MYKLTIALALCAMAASASAADLQSRTIARELVTVMGERHLDAIAAKDPADEGRFVAALYYPNSQLLVVSAKYPSPALIQASLDAKAYRDVYTALQQAGVPESKLFVQDLGADGLHAAASQPVDVVYEKVVNQTIFDKDEGKPDSPYTKKLSAADQKYAHVLQLLLDAARQ